MASLQKTLAAQLEKILASTKPEASALREKYLLDLNALETEAKSAGNADAAREAAAEFSRATAASPADLFRSLP